MKRTPITLSLLAILVVASCGGCDPGTGDIPAPDLRSAPSAGTPEHAAVELDRITANLAEADPEEARSILDRVFDLADRNRGRMIEEQALGLIAHVALQRLLPERAIRAIRELSGIVSKEQLAILRLDEARMLAFLGRFDEALGVLDEIAGEEAVARSVPPLRSALLFDSGRAEEGLAVLRAETKRWGVRSPGLHARRELVRRLVGLGRDEEAMAEGAILWPKQRLKFPAQEVGLDLAWLHEMALEPEAAREILATITRLGEGRPEMEARSRLHALGRMGKEGLPLAGPCTGGEKVTRTEMRGRTVVAVLWHPAGPGGRSLIAAWRSALAGTGRDDLALLGFVPAEAEEGVAATTEGCRNRILAPAVFEEWTCGVVPRVIVLDGDGGVLRSTWIPERAGDLPVVR